MLDGVDKTRWNPPTRDQRARPAAVRLVVAPVPSIRAPPMAKTPGTRARAVIPKGRQTQMTPAMTAQTMTSAPPSWMRRSETTSPALPAQCRVSLVSLANWFFSRSPDETSLLKAVKVE